MAWLWHSLAAYAAVSALIAVAWELEEGGGWESTAYRLGRIAVYAVIWPALAVVAIWFFSDLDPDDPFL